MQRLKNILRFAVKYECDKIVLRQGQKPSCFKGQNVRDVPEEPPLSGAEFAEFFGFLFPKQQVEIQGQLVTRGTLNVKGVGDIYLIALPTPPYTLNMYIPPSGSPLFENEFKELSRRADSSHRDEKPVIEKQVIEKAPSAAQGYIPIDDAEPLDPEVSIPADRKPPPISQKPQDNFAYVPEEQSKVENLRFRDPSPALRYHGSPEDFSDQSISRLNEALSIQYPQHSKVNPVDGKGGLGHGTGVQFSAEAAGASMISQGSNAIDSVLIDMIQKKASDVHFTTGQPIIFRIDGDIKRINQEPTTPEKMKAFVWPIMPEHNKDEFAKSHDTDFAYEIGGHGRFRVNVFRDKNGVGMVIRYIPTEILDHRQLALPPSVMKFCGLTKGLVLVTGPTGSGKSTTLAAMIDYINKNRMEHILTIEDPIEFVHPQLKCLINQREVHRHTKSFSRALKAGLREDPDVVLIGEMRDLETIAIAIETAETGHLVFGTLHTTTAVSTVDRIIDQFPPDRQEQIRMMLAESLKGVIAQSLVRKKTGGRTAAYEILVANMSVAAMIREGKNHMIQNHMQSQRQEGNILLNESLLRLIKDRSIEPLEAYRNSVDKVTFLEMMRRAGIRFDPESVHRSAPHRAS
jgi:pilus retraction protein PilT